MTRPSRADPVSSYARAVVRGRVVAGPWVRAACQRHLDDLVEGPARGLVWSLAHMQRALDFFPEVLRLSEGKFDGRRFELHPSQAFIVGSLFGWLRADGTRRFRRAFVEQGKGNGKSPLAGGIGLYGMVADREKGAQVFAAAAKLDQARILFNDAVSMVQQSPLLSEQIVSSGINPIHTLWSPRNGAYFKPLGRDTRKTGSGLRPHFVLADEVHEHPNREIIEMLERGFKSRRQPLLFMITNSGSDRNSVAWEEHQFGIEVLEGARTLEESDPAFFYICALDEDDDPLKDPSCWLKANPLLGVTITEEYLAGVVAQARSIAGRMNGILRLHFCVWTDAESAWISRETWEDAEDATLRLEDMRGRQCWIGLDLGATRDLTGMAFLFEDGVTDEGQPRFALFGRGFTPEKTLRERADRDKAPYPDWVADGVLIATPGPVIRLDYVARAVIEASLDFDLVAVAYDRWLVRAFEVEVDALGGELPLIEHPQSINRRKDSPLWMPESIDNLEALILEGRLRIEVNRALRSAVAGTTFWESAAGLRRFEKQRAVSRIDLAVAAAMAVGAATSEVPAEDESYMSATGPILV